MRVRMRADGDEAWSKEIAKSGPRERDTVVRKGRLDVSMYAVADVQHDRDSVTDEHRNRAIGEVGGTVIEGHDDWVTFGYCTTARAPRAARSSVVALPSSASSAICSSKRARREIDLDRRPSPDPVVLEQHDTARRRHDAVGRCG